MLIVHNEISKHLIHLIHSVVYLEFKKTLEKHALQFILNAAGTLINQIY